MANLQTFKNISLNNISEPVSWFVSNLFQKKSLYLLKGELGAGKTEFVKKLGDQLDVNQVASPSFAICNQYQDTTGNNTFYHVDLYRIKNEDDLESSGFWDLFLDEGPVFVEWAEYINPEYFPLGWEVVSIKIKKNPDDTRDFVFEQI